MSDQELCAYCDGTEQVMMATMDGSTSYISCPLCLEASKDEEIRRLRAMLGDSPGSGLTPDESEFAAQHHGVFQRDGVWYRLKGWGSADEWDVFPLVVVPEDHATAIVDAPLLRAENERLRAALCEMAERYVVEGDKLKTCAEQESPNA